VDSTLKDTQHSALKGEHRYKRTSTEEEKTMQQAIIRHPWQWMGMKQNVTKKTNHILDKKQA
jgi:hypothetical protein